MIIPEATIRNIFFSVIPPVAIRVTHSQIHANASTARPTYLIIFIFCIGGSTKCEINNFFAIQSHFHIEISASAP